MDAKQRTIRETLNIVIDRHGPYGVGGPRLGTVRSPLDSLSNYPRGSGPDGAGAASSLSNAGSGSGAPTILHVLIAFLLCLLLMALVGFALVFVLRRRAELRAVRRKQDAQLTKQTPGPTPTPATGGAPTPDQMEERSLQMRIIHVPAEKRSLLEGAPPPMEASNTFEVPFYAVY